MTLPALRRLCKLWQKRLRISDWTIDLSWGSPEEMASVCGLTLYDPRNMIAAIRIDEHMDDEMYLDLGFEQTLIHELLHIVMHGWVDYEAENIMQERSINHIADALYWSYRAKPRARA
jgi:hypothetical protein